MAQELFRFEPYWGKWIFSYNLEIYALEEEPFGDDVHKVVPQSHPINGLSAPYRVQIQVTNRCNFSCPHCYVSSGNPLPEEMSFEQIKELLPRLKDWGVLQITWSGGEVFSRKNFLVLARYSQSLGFENSVLTNGYAIGKVSSIKPEELWQIFVRIQISVDGWDKNFDTWVGMDNAWNFVKKGIDDLYDCKPEEKILNVTTTISEDLGSWEHVANYVHQKDILWRIAKQVQNGRSLIEVSTANDQASVSFIEIQRLQTLYNIKVLHPYDKSLPEDNMLPKEWQVEPGARWYLYIKANGDVYPFPYLDGLDEYKAGNVLQGALDELWFSNAFNRYREVTYENSGCAGCPYICQMWIRSFNIFPSGDIFSTPPLHLGCFKT